MKIFAIDTSTLSTTVCYYDGNKIFSKTVVSNTTHSTTLMPLIDELVRENSISINNADFFAVTVGPGSFTGLRIGLSTIMGLAKGYNKKILPINTLDCYSYNDFINSVYLCTILNANRNEVYSAIYKTNENDPNPLVILEPCAISLEKLIQTLKTLNGSVVLYGEGTTVFHDTLSSELDNVVTQDNVFITGDSLIKASINLIDSGMCAVNPSEITLKYLRKSQAEEDFDNKKSNS